MRLCADESMLRQATETILIREPITVRNAKKDWGACSSLRKNRSY